MTHLKFRLPFSKRGRVRRPIRRRDDPAAVFKNFVVVLERMQAQSRAACHTPFDTQAEQAR